MEEVWVVNVHTVRMQSEESDSFENFWAKELFSGKRLSTKKGNELY